MGQETSSMLDPSVPPETLRERNLDAVAELIKDGRARQIVVLTGAGISTAAGIPDFRSPDTGLYANLQRLDLPYAEAVFDISFFRQNPKPFYLLASELYPGRYHPTISHVFIALLARKRLLRMLFTQNIDCLERAAGVPGDLIVEAHGSFATQRCIECQTPFPDEDMRRHVQENKVPRCGKRDCDGLVKPDIVFFGEMLPKHFEANRFVPALADLVLIMGTSLSVQPFASLPLGVPEATPRVLLNRERVGGIGSRADDVLVLEDCDSGIRKLADALGWRDELEKAWRDLVGDEEADKQLLRAGEAEKKEELEPEIAKIPEERKEVLEKEIDDMVAAFERKFQVLEAGEDSQPLSKKVGDGDQATSLSDPEGTAAPDAPVSEELKASSQSEAHAPDEAQAKVEAPVNQDLSSSTKDATASDGSPEKNRL